MHYPEVWTEVSSSAVRTSSLRFSLQPAHGCAEDIAFKFPNLKPCAHCPRCLAEDRQGLATNMETFSIKSDDDSLALEYSPGSWLPRRAPRASMGSWSRDQIDSRKT